MYFMGYAGYSGKWFSWFSSAPALAVYGAGHNGKNSEKGDVLPIILFI